MRASINPKRPAAVMALAASVLAASLLAGPPAAPEAAAQAAGCPGNPSHLSPKGGPAARFTMLLRVNKPRNIDQLAQLQADRGQLRARDIFVVNTRFGGSSPEKAREIVSRLTRSFPCNRIVTLNGLGSDPRRPGYAFALADSPHLWAVLLDWEHRDWRRARATNSGLSRWKRRFGRALKRLRARSGDLARNLKRNRQRVGGGARRVGAVPTYYHDWHYGRIARVLDQRSRRFGKRRGGIQVVATQETCRKQRLRGRRRGGKAARKERALKRMRPAAGRLHRHYGKFSRKRRNLAFQVSFSDRAKAKRRLPIRSVNEGRAARCIRAGLRGGGGAFLLWASPDSVRALFQNGKLRRLRRQRA